MGTARLEAFSDAVLAIMAAQGNDSLLAAAVGHDLKGKLSPFLFVIAIPAAFVHQWIAGGIYVFVALMWLVPDRRIERVLNGSRDRGAT